MIGGALQGRSHDQVREMFAALGMMDSRERRAQQQDGMAQLDVQFDELFTAMGGRGGLER